MKNLILITAFLLGFAFDFYAQETSIPLTNFTISRDVEKIEDIDELMSQLEDENSDLVQLIQQVNDPKKTNVTIDVGFRELNSTLPSISPNGATYNISKSEREAQNHSALTKTSFELTNLPKILRYLTQDNSELKGLYKSFIRAIKKKNSLKKK